MRGKKRVKKSPLAIRARKGLVAHDNKKADLVEWADFNKGTLGYHKLYATGGTGKKIVDKTDARAILNGKNRNLEFFATRARE